MTTVSMRPGWFESRGIATFGSPLLLMMGLTLIRHSVGVPAWQSSPGLFVVADRVQMTD